MPTEPSPGEAAPSRGGRAAGIAVGSCAVVGLSLLAVTLLGRVDRAPAPWLSAGLFLLPYLHAAWAVAVFAGWCVWPGRRSFPAIGALGLAWVATVWGPSWVRDRPSAQAETVRVLSWNLRRLWGWTGDGGDPLACAVRGVQEAAPDLLALLEVSRENLDALEPALGMTCAHGTYRAGGGRRRGGLAVCARPPWTVVGADVARFDDDEDWHYVFAEVRRGDRTLNLLAVHLTPYHVGLDLQDRGAARGQANQAASLVDRVGRFRDPTVVAGDFNSTRDFWLHTALRERLVNAWERAGVGPGWTIRALGLLPLRVDHVYATTDLPVRMARVLPDDCSDHRGVLAELAIGPIGAAPPSP